MQCYFNIKNKNIIQKKYKITVLLYLFSLKRFVSLQNFTTPSIDSKNYINFITK